MIDFCIIFNIYVFNFVFKAKVLFQISGARISSQNVEGNVTIFDLTLDQIVTVTESFYPTFSPLEFLTFMGGAVGLWLGIGVVQMVHQGVGWATWIRSAMHTKK